MSLEKRSRVTVGTGSAHYVVADPWQLDIKGDNQEIPGVAVNSRGEVHLITRSPDPVLVYARDGTFLRSWGHGKLPYSHGMTIDPDDCVYVADTEDHVVRKFSPMGELLMTIGNPGCPSPTGFRDGDDRTITQAAGPFNRPTNVAVGPDGDIYVSDGYGNARIHRFDASGQLVRSWGETGSGPGEFRVPHGVALDSRNAVYVSDRENERVQVFDDEGHLQATWDDVRRPDCIFITPDDVVYVAELGYRAGIMPSMDMPTDKSPASRITMRDLNGRILGSWGAAEANDDPSVPGNFFAAHGICVDSDGFVYVGEVIHSGNGREFEGGAGWVPAGCHALQVFQPA